MKHQTKYLLIAAVLLAISPAVAEEGDNWGFWFQVNEEEAEGNNSASTYFQPALLRVPDYCRSTNGGRFTSCDDSAFVGRFGGNINFNKFVGLEFGAAITQELKAEGVYLDADGNDVADSFFYQDDKFLLFVLGLRGFYNISENLAVSGMAGYHWLNVKGEEEGFGDPGAFDEMRPFGAFDEVGAFREEFAPVYGVSAEYRFSDWPIGIRAEYVRYDNTPYIDTMGISLLVGDW